MLIKIVALAEVTKQTGRFLLELQQWRSQDSALGAWSPSSSPFLPLPFPSAFPSPFPPLPRLRSRPLKYS